NPSILFDYAKMYGQQGKSRFHGSYDEKRWQEFSVNAKKLGIDASVWPYYEIEEDFYSFNSLGYRTYEFSELQEGQFDLAIGCSYVEGLGLRQKETWLHHYENVAGVKLVNLGKGGASNTATKITLMSWLLGNYPKPRKIIVLWTEPSRDTYVREGGSYVSLNPGWQKIWDVHTFSDELINRLYETSLKHSSIWSNKFIDVYATVNLIAKTSGISLYNCFPQFFWKQEHLDVLKERTSFSGTIIDFDVSGGWMKFTNSGKIYPAADGIHHGWQHQLPIASKIYKVTHEKD
ncbi:MAG: hypothetical protein ACO22R_10285, partial [Chitinophagaceae bacterium]